MNNFGTAITVTIACMYITFLSTWTITTITAGSLLPPDISNAIQYRGLTTAIVAVLGSLGLLALSNKYRGNVGLWASFYATLVSIAFLMILLSDLGTLGCGNSCAGQGVSEQMASILSIIRNIFIGVVPFTAMLLTLFFGLRSQKPTRQ